MKFIAVIPARLQASRFPEKLLQPLGSQSVILTTYKRVLDSKLFDEILVATDSGKIYSEITKNGGNAVMTSDKHESGTDRIAEAVKNLEVDIIVNVQGDEPFIRTEPLKQLKDIFLNDPYQKIDVATLAQKIESEKDITNPNCVKVVLTYTQKALYFSRATIPYRRDMDFNPIYYKHIGVYAYRKKALEEFVRLPISEYEKSEKLEQLRFLENDYTIKVAITPYSTIGIDTPEDLILARELLNELEQ